MCGIIGTTNFNISEELMIKGLFTMKRRGPDFTRLIKENGVWFGHNRLAIIDLEERSNQPFTYVFNNQVVLITFNGEIYNFEALKNILITKGYIFSTKSDTEIIAASYLQWGKNCFDYFVGMWAIALKFNNTLILSRDRVGKKPLYYSISKENHISFSSSLKSLSIITSETEVSKEGLELYFALGFIPKKFSIFNNIFKLEPGQIMEFQISQNGNNLVDTYSSTLIEYDSHKNKALKELFTESVRLRLVSDVPIATLMSGGVDSTIVTVVTKSISKNLECFFVDFNDKYLSELKWATYLSNRNSIDFTKVLLDYDDLLSSFKVYYEVYEEPFADYSGIPSISIFKRVAKKYKVVLTGDGGDELFYGYPHYFKKYITYKLFTILKLFRNFNFMPKNLKSIVLGDKDNFESNYLKNHGILTSFSSQLINNEFNKSILRNNGLLKGMIDYDRVFYNWPDKYLVKIDRASMYSSVEVRSPFMDENLLKAVKKISLWALFTPYSKKMYLKIKYFKFFGLKYIIAKKSGFTPPIQRLRNEYFNNEDFVYTKEFIKTISSALYNEIATITFDDIKRDIILFDRFFFFHEWIKNYKKHHYV